MKKIAFFLLAVLLLVGCAAKEPTEPAEALPVVPQDLVGTWVSADPGELDMVETIVFEQDGSFSVQCDYRGEDAGTIYGTFTAELDTLICSITGGTTPYATEFTFRVDGRELVLTRDGSDAHYLKNA